MEQSLQATYAPNNACFGCGPANPDGLRLGSVVEGDEVVCTWTPKKMHEAFPGVLCGGVIGTLLDCHLNWAAAWHLMNKNGADAPPCTVTANSSIQLRRPTPTDGPVHLRARIVESSHDRATVTGTLEAGGKICATGEGLFVAVKEGHPAFHRW